MPEITEAQFREYQRYQQFGTPDEVDGRLKKNDELLKDNKAQRDEIKGLKEKLPADGAVVLTGDDAQAWPKYQGLGKPEDLEKVAKELGELQQKDSLRTREDGIRAAVKANGWPEETVATLLDMRSLEGALFEVKTEKADEKGKQVDVQVPYVTLAGDGQKPQKLAEFASASPQLKGLRTEAGGTPAAGGTSGGVNYPVQGSGATGKPGAAPTQEEIATAKNAAGAYAL